MPSVTGSSFTNILIPSESQHPVLFDITLSEPYSGSLLVSQSIKVEASGSEESFILGFVKEYDSGSLNLQFESQLSETTSSFSSWIVKKTGDGLT